MFLPEKQRKNPLGLFDTHIQSFCVQNQDNQVLITAVWHHDEQGAQCSHQAVSTPAQTVGWLKRILLFFGF